MSWFRTGMPAAFIFPAHVLRRHLIIREVAASLTGDVSALAALLRNAGWYPIPAGTTDMAMFELSVIR